MLFSLFLKNLPIILLKFPFGDCVLSSYVTSFYGIIILLVESFMEVVHL